MAERTRLMKIFIVFLFIIVLPAESQESKTEAGAPCFGEECLKQNGDFRQMQKLCLKSLPDFCQEPAREFPQYTICTPVVEGSFGAGGVVTSCIDGILVGAIDSAHVALQIAKGLYKGIVNTGKSLLTDGGDVLVEALDVSSAFMEEISGPDGDEKLREILMTGMDDSVKEFSQCLNRRGMVEFFCEVGTQTLVLTNVTAAGLRTKYRIEDRLSLLRKGSPKVKLRPWQKLKQRRQLVEFLNNKQVPASQLTPYQWSLLKPQYIKNIKFNDSDLTSHTLSLLNKKQLKALPDDALRRVDAGNISKSLKHFSDRQFSILINNPKAKAWPALDLAKNMHRIPVNMFDKLENIAQVPLKHFSFQQISAMPPQLVMSISQRGGLGSLSIVKRRAFNKRVKEIKEKPELVKPVAAKPAATKPAAAKPAATKPAAAKPAATKPVATKPVATKPAATKPAAAKPAATKPAATKPAATKPAAAKPAAAKPAAAKPATTKSAAAKPAATKPAAAKPAAAKPAPQASKPAPQAKPAPKAGSAPRPKPKPQDQAPKPSE